MNVHRFTVKGRRFWTLGRIGGVALLFSLITVALAGGAPAGGGGQAIDFNTNMGGLATSICNAGNFLYGPIGWSIVVCVAVYGGLATWFGWRGGVGSLVGAFIGVFFMLALPGILTGLTFGNCVLTGAAGG
ncbi:MAG: hypothetical protein ACRCYY_04675 [Trueperaceae bacterium]